MDVALAEARTAAEEGEVPVGAVLVASGREIARGHNATLGRVDPTAHAEIVVLRTAARSSGNHRTGGTLYVSLEPCLMCMGALIQARVDRLVFAARDPKAGAAVSLFRLGADERLNHRFAVEQGPGAEAAARLLTDFFQARRVRR
jgi:tRNA(adenine34) deaminase